METVDINKTSEIPIKNININNNKIENNTKPKSELFNSLDKGESLDLKEKAENFMISTIGKDNLISNNVYIISLGITFIIISLFLFFISSTFRNGRTISSLKTYHNYQTIKGFDFEKNGDTKLIDYQITSSFNSCNTKNKLFDYLHLDILKNILRSGARYIEVKIFNSEFGEDTSNTTVIPVINNGTNKGEWKLCFNSIPFEDFCIFLKKNAFQFLKIKDDGDFEGVPNPDDPLFLALDLKTNNNINVLNKINKILIKTLDKKFLKQINRNYREDKNHLINMKMKDLKSKLVILSGDGFQGSELDKTINGYWGNKETDIPHKINRIFYDNIKDYDLDENKKLKDVFKKKIKNELTIIIPDKDEDKDGNINMNIFEPMNYNTKIALNLGCNFVSVYYQSVDNFMDDYITKFKEYSIIKKKYNFNI